MVPRGNLALLKTSSLHRGVIRLRGEALSNDQRNNAGRRRYGYGEVHLVEPRIAGSQSREADISRNTADLNSPGALMAYGCRLLLVFMGLFWPHLDVMHERAEYAAEENHVAEPLERTLPK